MGHLIPTGIGVRPPRSSAGWPSAAGPGQKQEAKFVLATKRIAQEGEVAERRGELLYRAKTPGLIVVSKVRRLMPLA